MSKETAANQTEQTKKAEEKRVALFIEWKGKKYFVPEGLWDSTAVVRESDDAIEMRPFCEHDDGSIVVCEHDDWVLVEEEVPNKL